MKFNNARNFQHNVHRTFCRIEKDGNSKIGYVSCAEGTTPEVVFEHDVVQHLRDWKTYTFHAPVLGYIQYGDTAYYVSRSPVRRYRLGLSDENVKSQFNLYANIRGTVNCLSKCWKGEYILFDVAEKHIQEGWNSVAISRRYAITANSIMYRNQPVATIQNGMYVFNSETEQIFHENNLRSLGVMKPFTYRQLPDLENYNGGYDI